MRASALAWGLMLVGSVPLAAAAQAAPARPSFGLMGAANLSTLGGSGVTGSGNRAGISVGAFLRIPLAPSWSLQPELEYAAKGAQTSSISGTSLLVSTLDLRYVEMPLLFRVASSGSRGVHLFGEFGPAPAAELDCTLKAVQQDTTVSLPCHHYLSVHSFDIGAMVGGGFEFPYDSHSVSLGVRYNLGMTTIATGGDAKNRNLQFVAGLWF